jgi:ribosomal protein L11 methyltransferase
MKKFVQIEVRTRSEEEGDILIAQLPEINFYAFEQKDEILNAYINEEDFVESQLIHLLPENISYISRIIEDRNWNQEWEGQFQPIQIGNFVGIRTIFHKPFKNVAHELIITPKMSFGTGHHATTFLVIELMEQISFKNKRVLDFGTGTGILAILAEKLGASQILAIDYDEWSITNAGENIRENNCTHIILQRADNIGEIPVVNIIIANINLSILTENTVNFAKLLMPSSHLIISGFLASDEEQISSCLAKSGFMIKMVMEKQGWAALLVEKQ